jgi:hypothetical protein
VPSGPICRSSSCASACVSATSPRLRTPCIATDKVRKPETSSSQECPAAPGGTSGRYGTRGRKPLLSIYPSQLLFPAGAPLAFSSAVLLSQNAHQFGLRENGKLFPGALFSPFAPAAEVKRKSKSAIGSILAPTVVPRETISSLSMNDTEMQTIRSFTGRGLHTPGPSVFRPCVLQSL